MSWFDASGFTNLAKSALKEAQKTIDKALDIQQEENEQIGAIKKQKSLTESTAAPSENSDFFTSWGIPSSNSLNLIAAKDQPVVTQSPSKAMAQSLWGSFTGSFFEPGHGDVGNPRTDSKNGNNESQKHKYDLNNPSDVSSTIAEDLSETSSDNGYKTQEITSKSEGHSVLMRRMSDKQQNSYLNRLSIISSESGKNSSESIEVLGSQSLKTTPDSEITSLQNSVSSSSLGIKLASSSIEVLPDSLVSPSSIELLGFTHSSEISHASDDEFNSPASSPLENDKQSKDITLRSKSDTSSPHNTDEEIKILNNVNVLNNDDDDDTISYNSISEFTVPTVLDGSNIYKAPEILTRKPGPQYCNEMIDSFGSDISNSTGRTLEDVPITRAPARSVSQFSSITTGANQNLIYEKSHPELEDRSNCDNVIQPNTKFQSLISDSYTSSNDGSWSDRTLSVDMEGVIIEPNSDDVIEKQSDKCSVSGLLADALIDKLNDKTSDSSSYCKINEEVEITPWKDVALSTSSYEEVDKASSIDILESEHTPSMREPNSPVSSEGVSIDIVKIGSEQTSGHTSGDDLETTTSSDIEIIPSPNGDYGNNYCINRQSPAKIPNKLHKHASGNVVDLVLGKALASKIRGHTRELSAASNQSNASDDSHCSEAERLMKRLAEMAEILESREAKLIEISRNNVELTESNAELKLQVENLGKQDITDVSLITEEYTQRLSALEKKFQQAIREKDTLRKQMETYKQEAASRMTANELESAIGERDETIKELREEGEKLSKQQLHHTTIIKRIRAKEKDNEQVIKTLRDKVAEQTQELDRLKRSMSAKEAVECTQIEVVYKLTTANKKLDTELLEAKEQLDDANQKYETVKKSFDAAKKEISDLKKNCNDSSKKEEALSALEKEKAAIESENEQLSHQVDDLRSKMRQEEQRWMSREATLRSEVSSQMARAEEAESALMLSKNDGYNSGGGSGVDGGALLAQLSALQESSLERDRRFQTTERRLQQTASDAQANLLKALENNQVLKDECLNLRTKLTSIEINLTNTTQKLDNCLSACEEHMSQLNITLESKEKLKHDYDHFKSETNDGMKELNERLKTVEDNLNAEKSAHDAERRRSTILQEQLKDLTISADQTSGSSMLLARLVGTGEMISNASNMDMGMMAADRDQEHSPPPGSTGRDSLASESLGSGVWPDDGESCLIGNVNNMRDGLIGNSGNGIFTVERLQAALQRREGELRAARKAGRRSHAQRTALARELALHAAELDTMQSVQHQYDALLQMYGEKEEQLQELRLDLQDVKDMYKMQLDEILMLKRQAQEQNSQQK